jgi:GT2 family glycosyltransferase
MREILELVPTANWIARLDDDLEQLPRDTFAKLLTAAATYLNQGHRIGAVGGGGAVLKPLTGRLVGRDRLRAISCDRFVDYLATNLFPLFLLDAVRDVGVFSSSLFYGSSEVEYGLRLRRAGYTLVEVGSIAAGVKPQRQTQQGRWRLPAYTWRRYYSIRNQVHIFRTFRYRSALLYLILLRLLIRPVVALPLQPATALSHLRWNWAAVKDGLSERLGRTVDPTDPPLLSSLYSNLAATSEQRH